MNETELLFTDVLNCDRLSLYLNRDTVLDKNKSILLSSILKRRILGEPIQYILGKVEFMGLEFKVNKDVFIPRPETEILVEIAINIVKLLSCQTVKLLDIGTGSGNIAVSLAKFLPRARIYATEISKQALEVAKDNAKSNNVEINFIQSDLFNNYELRTNNYELIISNPPYIATSEIELLQPEIRYEPRIALDGDKDGLDFFRRIIKEAPKYLKENGFLIMEMGFNQAESVKNIFQNSPGFEIIEVVKDYNNIERVIVAQWIN